MAFVMFDVYSSVPLGLNGDDAEALAVVLDKRSLSGLAGRVRYGLANEALVTLDPDERIPLADALEELHSDAANEGQVANLAANLRARAAGGDLPTPRVE